jgi:hypothetical protein
MKCDIIFPKIHVYKGMLPGHEELVSILKDSEKNPNNSFVFKDWQPWSIFGSYVYQIGNTDIPRSEERFVKEKHYLELVKDAFYKTTDNFLKYYSLKIPEDWSIMGPSFSKYNPDDETKGRNGNGLAMLRHTDYVPWLKGTPGYKFAVTCTMYLNDDYEGGEISFKIGEDIIDYKPVAGDIIVFPSGHPDFLSQEQTYLHGVRSITGNSRYLIRCFYKFYDEGSKEWHEGRDKYGEKEWEKMEEERFQNEMKKYGF